MKEEITPDIWTRLYDIDHRIVYLITIIACAGVMIQPIGLPVKISPNTKTIYELIEAMPSGSLVHTDMIPEPANIADIGYGSADMISHLFRKGARIVFTTGVGTHGQSATPYGYDTILGWADLTGKKYGEDYVYLGFLGDSELAYATFARDPKGFGTTDYYGTPIDELPIMKDIKSYDDFYITACSHSGPELAGIIVPLYKKPFVTFTQSANVLTYLPYVPQLITAVAGGIRQAAEYELLLKKPSYGASAIDAQSIAALVVILFVLGGNIAYIVKRGEVEK